MVVHDAVHKTSLRHRYLVSRSDIIEYMEVWTFGGSGFGKAAVGYRQVDVGCGELTSRFGANCAADGYCFSCHGENRSCCFSSFTSYSFLHGTCVLPIHPYMCMYICTSIC